MDHTLSASRRYSLYLVSFANSAGLIAITVLLPEYIDLLDPSGIAIGLFVSGLTFAQAVAVVPLGWAGDRFDKRQILLGALIACAIAYSLFPFVTSSAGFIAVRFLQGLSVVGVSLLGLSLIGELAEDDERANLIGKFNSWKLAAGVIGTLGAGALYQWFGFPVVFGLLVGLFLLATLGVWRFVRADTSTVGFAFGRLAVNRRILTLTSFRSQYAFAVTIMRNWIPIFVGVSVAQGGLGYSTLIVGIVVATERGTNMVCQPFTGRLSDRNGRARFVFLGGGAYGLIALMIPAAHRLGTVGLPGGFTVSGALLGVLVLNGLLGVADAFREPASMALFADEGSREGGIASSFGIRSLVWRPGNVIAPLIGGVVMTNVGMAWVFYLGGAFAVSGALTMLAVLWVTHGRHALTTW